jgi:hypothetical protein
MTNEQAPNPPDRLEDKNLPDDTQDHLDDPWAEESTSELTSAPPEPFTEQASGVATTKRRPDSSSQESPRAAVQRQRKSAQPSKVAQPSKTPQETGSVWENSTMAAAKFIVELLTDAGPKLRQILSQIHPRLRQLQTRIALILRQIRKVLPAAWNDRLSDPLLGSLLVGMLVILLWILPGLVSTLSTIARFGAAPPEASPQIFRPVSDNPLNLPALKSDQPPPPLDLAPQPELIADLQAQLAEVSNQYGAGLILGTEANFRSSRLMVQLGDGWYDLRPTRQDQLAMDLLKRSRLLKFHALELVDRQNHLLARSPFVGDDMVIVNRMEAENSAYKASSTLRNQNVSREQFLGNTNK